MNNSWNTTQQQNNNKKVFLQATGTFPPCIIPFLFIFLLVLVAGISATVILKIYYVPPILGVLFIIFLVLLIFSSTFYRRINVTLDLSRNVLTIESYPSIFQRFFCCYNKCIVDRYKLGLLGGSTIQKNGIRYSFCVIKNNQDVDKTQALFKKAKIEKISGALNTFLSIHVINPLQQSALLQDSISKFGGGLFVGPAEIPMAHLSKMQNRNEGFTADEIVVEFVENKVWFCFFYYIYLFIYFKYYFLLKLG